MSALAGAALAAMLELDVAHAGQILVSRPLVLGALTGWFIGAPVEGAVQGAVFELLGLNELPLGGHLRWSAPVAAAAATLLAGQGVGPPIGLAAGLAVGWAHARLERGERAVRTGVVATLSRRVEAGAPPRQGIVLIGALLAHFVWTFALLAAATLLLPHAGLALWERLPHVLRAAAAAAAASAPWLGLAWLATRGARRA